eukprot:CAMPEP_0197462610 /NCGR_PEP_ID=MMETSP1175-20131217/59578_1 /TAXON_ID=1003142 /ORGANISM="Triceratium dubium, Strain CCMP147" /LENGTH=139 /DNA_ID=CAMNT_0042998161 /DNA_START=405 /DNA_END=824 /DNA_ORIENTATION=+
MDDEGAYMIEREPDQFSYIIRFLHGESTASLLSELSMGGLERLQQETDFYQIDELYRGVRAEIITRKAVEFGRLKELENQEALIKRIYTSTGSIQCRDDSPMSCMPQDEIDKDDYDDFCDIRAGDAILRKRGGMERLSA